MRILVIAGCARSLVRFRGFLLQRFIDEGYVVHAAAPDIISDQSATLKLVGMGVETHVFPMSRAGLSPISDLMALLSLGRLMLRIGPDVVLAYTIKSVIWGTLAAWATGVPHRVSLITGLGYAFTGEFKGKRRFVNGIARWLYRLALNRATLVFFQNRDDAALFRKLAIVPKTVPVVVVNGSGVDTEAFSPARFAAGGIRFLLIARLIGDKGIREYVAAATVLRKRHPEVEFHLVGGLDPNPDAIREPEVQSWQASGAIVWHGALADVRPSIGASHVYVLPSYREGTPRTVLEAMAMGRPIITTDAPGCRETVIEGKNGFLVPVRSVDGLVLAMRRFIEQPELIERMGRRSREIAEQKYDVHKVNAVMLKAMGLA